MQNLFASRKLLHKQILMPENVLKIYTKNVDCNRKQILTCLYNSVAYPARNKNGALTKNNQFSDINLLHIL